MQPGIRVLRGPDWCYSDQDGGPGFLGTVVKFLSNNRAVVVWDVGTVTECRAGSQGAFDLRVYDNAQIGVKQVICDGACLDTDDNNDYGFRWKDLESEDRDQCTPCYMKDMGEADHAYVRFVTRKSLVERVEPRSRSRSIPLVGIFPGAEVKPSAAVHTEGDYQVGVVKELINYQDSYRGAVTVEWKNKPKTDDSDEEPELSTCRLGADGKVDLKLVTTSPEKRHVYIDHLPVLDLTMPVDIEFRAGDKVRMDMHLQTFRALQNEYGGWTEEMETLMGEEGVIERVLDEPRRLARVRFGDQTVKAIYMNTLTKLHRFNAGDYVRIIDDVSAVKKAQAAHGGWQDSLSAVLGQVGRIKRVDTSGDVFITVQDHTYVFNQSCLQPLRDEEKRIFLSDDPYGSMPIAQTSSSTRGKVPSEARRTCQRDQYIGIGVRVVRGPDWRPEFGNQDGGEGHLGSIVEIGGQKGSDFPEDCVMVQWDMGEKDLYRAGFQGAYDIRVFDNAGIGVKHNAQCRECRAMDICGIIWKDSENDDITLCSECYASDRQDINHQFVRINCPGDKGVKVPKRSMSRKLTAKGISEQSKVKRGPNWRWQNQDDVKEPYTSGGQGKTGEVIAIVNFSPDTDHDAVEVTWENGYTNVYRLGYKGSLDVQCVRPASGGYYYRDHLPILKLDTGSVQLSDPNEDERAKGAVGGQDRFKEGDKVRIEIDQDILKTIEKERGSWNDMMIECIGKTGTVKLSNDDGEITADFGQAGTWTFSEMSLVKVKEFVPGEIVRVNSNIEIVRRIQDDTVGWNELMAKVVGKRGKVEGIDEDGDIQVSFGEYTWTFNEECLIEDKGESDTVSYNQEPAVDKENSGTEDTKINKLFDAVEKGDNQAVERLVSRNPNLLTEKHLGKPAIHWACYKGELGIVQTLISGGNFLDMLTSTDEDGCTPLLAAVKGRQLQIVQMLSELGADKQVINKSKQNAVHLAVSNKDVTLLRFLRDNDFNVNQEDVMEQTPVFDAIMSDNPDVAKIILEWPGVKIKYQDNLSFSPFFIACRKGDKKIVHQLLQMAPDELNSVKKTDGFTGLHIAVLNGKTELVKFLLNQNGIKFDLPSADGRTPLLVACSEGHVDIVKILLDKGSKRDAVDSSKRNCLHLCVLIQEEQEGTKTEEQIVELAELLIRNGIPHELPDSSGKTPEDLASDTIKQRIFNQRQRGKQTQSTGTERKQGSPFGQINNPMTQSMYSGNSSQPRFQSPTSSLMQGQTRAVRPNISPSAQGQCQPRMTQSMIVTPNLGLQDQAQNFSQSQGQGLYPCPSCEEESATRMLLPCKHAFCADCAPKKKMKRKVCPECKADVFDMVENTAA